MRAIEARRRTQRRSDAGRPASTAAPLVTPELATGPRLAFLSCFLSSLGILCAVNSFIPTCKPGGGESPRLQRRTYQSKGYGVILKTTPLPSPPPYAVL